MTLKLIMNTNGTVDHDSGSAISDGSFTIASTADLYTKAEGAGVYREILNGGFSGGSASGFVDNSVFGLWEISPTATKTKATTALVLREGDTGTLNGVGTLDPTPTPPAPPTGPVSGDVIVDSAGQTKAKAQ